MTRIFIYFALLLFFLFLTFIGMIGARPSSYDELHDFLVPPDCVLPCWQGIRPGVTTGDEAMTILQHHPWISRATQHAEFVFANVDNRIDLTWSGQQPGWINGAFDGAVGIRDNIVRWIAFETNIPLGEIVLALGRLEIDMDEFRFRNFHFVYPANQLTVGTPYRQTVARILPETYDVPTGIVIGEIPQWLVYDFAPVIGMDWSSIPMVVIAVGV